jgi:hypothetical protein
MAQFLIPLDPLRDLESGDLRQLNIHQNEIGFMQPRQLQRFPSATSLQGLVAMRLQEVIEQFHVQLIVFDDQYALLHRGYEALRGTRSRALKLELQMCLAEKKLTVREIIVMQKFRYGSSSGDGLALAKDAAESMAIEVLGFLAEDSSRLSRFLAFSGLGRENLRAAAQDPAFLAAVLDHLASDEPTLLAFAEKSGHEPAAIVRARAVLSPPPEPP